MSNLEVLVYPVLLYLIFASITPIECPTVVSNQTSITTHTHHTLAYVYELTYCNATKMYIRSCEGLTNGLPLIVQEWVKQHPSKTFHQTIFGLMRVDESYFMRILATIMVFFAGSAHVCALINLSIDQRNRELPKKVN
jgi:hypothetical protein